MMRLAHLACQADLVHGRVVMRRVVVCETDEEARQIVDAESAKGMQITFFAFNVWVEDRRYEDDDE